MSLFAWLRTLAAVALFSGVALCANAHAAVADSIWCPNGVAHGDGHSYQNLEDAAWDSLCQGDFNRARSGFEMVYAHFSEFGLQDPTLYTLQRGYIFSLWGTYGDKEARRALDRFEGSVLPQYRETEADRSMERMHVGDAFEQYIGAANLRPGADPALEAAAACAKAGDYDTASKLLEADRNGPLNTLLLGDASAAQNRWSDAINDWIAVASIPSRIQPDQNYAIDPMSFTAMEMLAYFYRDHANAH